MEDIMEKHDIIKKQLVFVEDYCHGDKSEALVNLRVLIRSHLNTDASSTLSETAYCRHSKISESCLECQKLVMDKKVKDRSQQQHLFLIKNKFNGSVRDYLLSMGAFKDVNIDDAEDSVIEEKIDAHTKVSMEAYDQGINDLLNMIEMHYFKGDHYYQEVKELANVLRHDAEDSISEPTLGLKKFEYKCICDWSKDDEYGFIPMTSCPAHGKEAKELIKGGKEWKGNDGGKDGKKT